MTDPSFASALDAAVRVVCGESDLAAVRHALDNWRLAPVIASAPTARPVAGAIAALCGGLPSLLDPATVDDPAFHDAMTRLIGTPAGQTALRAWAEVAPAGWGAAHAEALIDAVQRDMCDARVAAALIGACDASAALLSDPDDAAFALRRWGQAVPDAPTAWMGALSAGERRRLLATMRGDPLVIASCLPWLPSDAAYRKRLDDVDVGVALDAFATASPASHSLHAARLRRLVARANPTHLAEIMRLARVMDADGVWRRVETLIRASPEEAWRIVATEPWDALPETVRAAILERADESDVCAAVAVAQGRRTRASMSWSTAIAFFAALVPAVWDALDTGEQQRWRHALVQEDGHLVVRSLGLRPEVLARAPLTDDLVRAVRRHARGDAATLRWALLPVALRNLPMDDSHDVIAAMPTLPPDVGAFFCIASNRGDPSIIDRARTALRTPADLACAVVMQRITEDDESIRVRSAALRRALHGRTGDDLAPILALLTDDARAALMPDRDALVARLADSAHRDALRRALDGLDSLPLEASVPALSVLTRWTASHAADAADALADALQAHSDAFLAVADALASNDQIGAALPLPDDPALACTLRSLAQDDPVTARRLAHALQTHDRRVTLLALLQTAPAHADAVWQALDDDVRQEIGSVVVAPPDADPPAKRDPLAALALAAVQSDDADLRDAGVMALAARPDIVRMMWMTSRQEMLWVLRTHPAVADLLHAPHASAVGRRRW